MPNGPTAYRMGKPEMQRFWTGLLTAVPLMSALATAFLAYNALQSAKIAADIAAGVAALSQRAFVAPTHWILRTDPNGRPAYDARLHDVAGVPALVAKVCIWQSGESMDYDRRSYTDVTARGGSLAFQSLYYNVPFPPIGTTPPSSTRRYFGIVYTFSREGDASTVETWRVDAEVDLTTKGGTTDSNPVRVMVMRRAAKAPC